MEVTNVLENLNFKIILNIFKMGYVIKVNGLKKYNMKSFKRKVLNGCIMLDILYITNDYIKQYIKFYKILMFG